MVSVQIMKDEGIVSVEPYSPLEAADFEQLSKAVDAYIEEAGAVNGLLIHAKSFPGWEDFSGFIHHIRFVKEHHRKIRRVAIATDSKLMTIAPAFAKHFVAAEIRHFDYDDMEQATQWLRCAE